MLPNHRHRRLLALGRRASRASVPARSLALALTVSPPTPLQAYISTHTLRDTLDVSLHPHSNPHPWTKVSPDTPPPTSAFVPKSERMSCVPSSALCFPADLLADLVPLAPSLSRSAGHSSYTAGIFDSLKHAAAHRAAH